MKEAEVVYALAHIAPATTKEVAEFMNIDTSGGSVSTTITRTWRSGLLIRRRRDSDNYGEDPFEYALRPADGDNA